MVNAQRGSVAEASRPTLLVIGRPGEWPASLLRLANENRVQLECVGGVHEAAARLKRGSSQIVGVLIDGEGLSRREWAMMSVLQRHISQPLWSLPARLRRDLPLPAGVRAWGEAERALEQLPMGNTPVVLEGNKGILQSAKNPQERKHNHPAGLTDKMGEKAPDKSTEMAVESGVADRYDESDIQPILSENEIRALLGPE